MLGSQVCVRVFVLLSKFLGRRSLGHVEGGRFPPFIRRTRIFHKASSQSRNTQTHGDRKKKLIETVKIGCWGDCSVWQCECVCLCVSRVYPEVQQLSVNTVSGWAKEKQGAKRAEMLKRKEEKNSPVCLFDTQTSQRRRFLQQSLQNAHTCTHTWCDREGPVCCRCGAKRKKEKEKAKQWARRVLIAGYQAQYCRARRRRGGEPLYFSLINNLTVELAAAVPLVATLNFLTLPPNN